MSDADCLPRSAPPLWARLLERVPNAKFETTAEVHRFIAFEGRQAVALKAANIEFVFRYYLRLLTLLSDRRRRSLQARVRPHGLQNLDLALRDGRGAVLVSAHLGDFELAGSWLCQIQGHGISVVVAKGDGRLRGSLFDRVRRSCGFLLRDQRETSLRDLAADLMKGRIVVMMVDRSGSGPTGHVHFLGHDAQVCLAPWLLAQRTGAPLVAAATSTAGDGGSDIFFAPPVRADGTRMGLQAVMSSIDGFIRSVPSQWHLPADLLQISLWGEVNDRDAPSMSTVPGSQRLDSLAPVSEPVLQ